MKNDSTPDEIVDIDLIQEHINAKMKASRFVMPEQIKANPSEKVQAQITHQIVWVDSATALKYLERNLGNRDYRPRSIARYTTAMLAGEWRLTHQGLAFDVDGRLIDGQHRLWAVVCAANRRPGIKIQFWVSKGWDAENYQTIDNGVPRVAADLLKESRKVVSVATAMVLGHRIGGGNFARSGSGKLRESEMRDFIDEYREGIDWAIGALTTKQFSNATITAVFARAAIAQKADRAKLLQFINLALEGGNGLQHPASLLRKVMATKPKSSILYRKLETALVAFLSDRNPQVLYGLDREQFQLPGWDRDRL